MKFFLLSLTLTSSLASLSQAMDTLEAAAMQTVEVKAFGLAGKLQQLPAAVSFIGPQVFNRFGKNTIVMAVNTTAGIKMEERSPGSYRINIRGSSLRSPFGVRNVKIYYNDLPFTDPGGQSYLNALSFYNFKTIEVVKGPGSSVYGAGTGGVLLIENVNAGEEIPALLTYEQGSFGLKNIAGVLNTNDAGYKAKVSFQHQQSEGYRQQSSIKKDVLSWSSLYTFKNNSALKTSFLFSDLFYKTPGALTKKEFIQEAAGARPPQNGQPGAIENNASIKQQTLLAGVSFNQRIAQVVAHSIQLYGSGTSFTNPTIRNYGANGEMHYGGRTSFSYTKQLRTIQVTCLAGAEWQQGLSDVDVYRNAKGYRDVLQSADEITTRQAFAFAQTNILVGNWQLTAGTSLNGMRLKYRRKLPLPLPLQTKNIASQLAPRLALARRLKSFTIYSSISKGFSPPTVNEWIPSGSSTNFSLNAEEGMNYDGGFRGRIAHGLWVDINAFLFQLKNTIVQRRDAAGGDFFVNAGRTLQQGIESSWQYRFTSNETSKPESSIWLAHTLHHFRYKEFKQLANDFSGKRMPGTAKHTISTGYQLTAKKGFGATAHYFFSSRIPLNDGNTEFADPYHLIGARFSYIVSAFRNNAAEFSVGIDNLLNERYSLGHDINAFGGRYYNAAPTRNFFVAVQLNWVKK